MTRRSFLALVPGLGTIVPGLGAFITNEHAQILNAPKRLTRDGDLSEIPKAEGFEVSGPLTDAAPDGTRGYYAIGTTTLMLPPDSALLPSTEALVGARVRLRLTRA